MTLSGLPRSLASDPACLHAATVALTHALYPLRRVRGFVQQRPEAILLAVMSAAGQLTDQPTLLPRPCLVPMR